MKFEQAIQAEIGDVMIASFTTSQMQVNDEVILIERAKDFNGIPNDTGGYFYNKRLKTCHGANIQDFNYPSGPAKV